MIILPSLSISSELYIACVDCQIRPVAPTNMVPCVYRNRRRPAPQVTALEIWNLVVAIATDAKTKSHYVFQAN